MGPGPAATWGNFSPSTVRSRPGGGREGAGGRRHSLSLPSSLCPPTVPQPLQPAREERVPKVSPGTARARGGPGAGCAELRAWGAPCLAPSGRTRLGSPGAHGPGALGTGWALRGRLGRSAPREAHGFLSSPWVLRFPRVCGRAAGDSFVVSAYASGRKGAEETDRRAGSVVEHRARDKQVGDGKVGGVAQPLALKMQKAHLAGQDNLSLLTIWHSIPEGAGWCWNLQTLGWTGGSTPEAGGAGEGILRQSWTQLGAMISEFQASVGGPSPICSWML